MKIANELGFKAVRKHKTDAFKVTESLYPPKLPVFPIHPGKQATATGNLTLPVPGSAFPAPF
jgi:hypothetical protein